MDMYNELSVFGDESAGKSSHTETLTPKTMPHFQGLVSLLRRLKAFFIL